MQGIIEILVTDSGASMFPVMRTTVPTLEELQKVVGGLIEPVFTIPSHHRRGVEITAYVNEEGLIYDMPQVIHLLRDGGMIQPLAGNMVITGLHRGNTVLLTDAEIMELRRCFVAIPFNTIAMLFGKIGPTGGLAAFDLRGWEHDG